MPLEWRSAAAQTFIGGRITKVDNFWRAAEISGGIVDLIKEWDLWDAAFGSLANRMRKDWETYSKGPSLAVGLATKAAKTVGLASDRALGSEIHAALQQCVTQPLYKLLQDTPLTINFNALSWFKDQAGFDEYSTMWDRKQTDNSLNVNPDPKNPAHVRAKADRWALYGQFDDGKVDAAAAGLKLAHVKQQGGVTAAPTWSHSRGSAGKTPKQVVADSQIFAALNYGRRPHGSNTAYGKSFFELSDDFKDGAVFFAMDTFTPVSTGSGFKTKDQRSKLYQVTARTFAGSMLLAIKSQYDGNPNQVNRQNSIALTVDLLKAARTCACLPDNDQNHLLIEAHLFQKVKMRSDVVKRVNVSMTECGTDLDAVKDNLRQFKNRTSIAFSLIP